MPESERNRLHQVLDAAAEALTGSSRIEIYGCREAVVDGCKGVTEYEEGRICLSLGKSHIVFMGRDLVIRSFDREHVEIEGCFSTVEFG